MHVTSLSLAVFVRNDDILLLMFPVSMSLHWKQYWVTVYFVLVCVMAFALGLLTRWHCGMRRSRSSRYNKNLAFSDFLWSGMGQMSTFSKIIMLIRTLVFVLLIFQSQNSANFRLLHSSVLIITLSSNFPPTAILFSSPVVFICVTLFLPLIRQGVVWRPNGSSGFCVPRATDLLEKFS